MQITLRCLIFAALVLFMACPPSISPPRPGCCGDPNSMPPRTVIFSQYIATRADEVPVELQGCGVNREEIKAIWIHGALAGCVDGSGVAVTFPNLVVDFTTSAVRCQGTQGELPQRSVVLRNVKYTASIQSGSSPACVSSSVVTWDSFDSLDPGFHTLFLTRGPQTMLPILDSYALGWAASIPSPVPSPPPVFCPPTPTLGGTTSRCPS
jgi:hypothetical protein